MIAMGDEGMTELTSTADGRCGGCPSTAAAEAPEASLGAPHGPATGGSAPAPDGASCFHCERALEGLTPVELTVDERCYAFCGDACRSAAQTILSRGLARFYEHRRMPPASGDGAGTGRDGHGQTDYAVYDREAAVERYTRPVGEHTREASLAVGGVHCAACSWLIEQAVAPLPGVDHISVNPATGRTLITLDTRKARLGMVLQAIASLGYTPQPVASGEEMTPELRERRTAIGRLAVAGLGMMQVMMYSAAQYMGAFQGIDPAIDRLFGLVSLLVATPVVFYSGQTFFRSALQGLRRGIAGMDVSVALAIAAAYGWSVWVMLGPDGLVPPGAHTYFDSVVMLIFLLLLGRFVEMSVRHHAGQRTDALARLLPSAVTRLDEAGREEIVDRHELRVGDRVRVLAGDAVPVDGTVERGGGDVDESMLTGEAAARHRACGDDAFGGTVLLRGSLVMRVTAVGGDTALSRIERLMDRAQAERPPLAGLADRIARYFVLALVVIASLVGAVWWQIDPARAFPVVLAVLVVTCPCALSLATPAALAAATTAFARRGMLVTRTSAIEALARVDTLVFDKTGTLTRAEPSLASVVPVAAGLDEDRCLAMAGALERHSRHPLARAFDGASGAVGEAQDVETVAGQGVAGTVDGRRLRIGQPSWAAPGARLPPELARADREASRSVVALGDGETLLALFTIADGLRDDAGDAVSALRDTLGVVPVIASGDGPGPVQAVADRLGIGDAHARQRPEDKLALLDRLRGEARRVGMIGDGINDAPVLAGADVSVAIAGGADLARVSADMVLLGEGLAPLPAAVRHARRTLDVIRQNLWWAAGYNALALPLAASGIVTPWMAAIGMSASSLVVVLNALRLRGTEAAPAAGAAAPAGGDPIASVTP
jgi:Cu2+-exporting ATPase